MKDRSLVKSFRRTFVMILISGILATLITYIIAILLYFGIQNIGKYPENFYEKQIPKIEAYIHEKNTDLLYVKVESGLNNTIKGNGIMYQVLNSECEVLYGTYKERVFADTDKLIDKINTTFVLKGRFAYIVPIGNGTKIEGAVILLYKLGNPYKNIGITIAVIAMLSPFLYFIIFTRLFSTSLVNKINLPLQLLIEASQKIKEKDLDFEVNYQSDNELGKLCTAFSEMKDELKKSLFSQWKAEQERIEMIEALAHDLKTPLSVIMAYSEALTEADSTDDEKLKTYLNVINGNAKKSSNLVMQMQYTSDLENANTNSVLRNVNLTEFLKKKISQYRFQAKQKEIDIVLNINSDLGYVMSDTDRLERILDNIFSNSLQYTPNKGSIKFFVNKENNKIVYEICDTGSGFTQ